MALNLVLEKEVRKSPPVISLRRGGQDVDLYVDEILVAWIDSGGILHIASNNEREVESLQNAGLSLDPEGYLEVQND